MKGRRAASNCGVMARDGPTAEARAALLARPLLEWYRSQRRTLPWRSAPSAYRVVVSEFMLQQTQVDRVAPAFERFVARFRSFADLAGAPSAEVVRAWRGLGYNARAVRLHALACIVRDRYGGALPAERDALRALPGVGDYTASAILAFAHGREAIAVDTNVRRVLQRAFFGAEPARAVPPRELERCGMLLLRHAGPFEVNSALMDLGSGVCTARAAKCLLCPLSSGCVSAPLQAPTPAPRAHAAKTRARVPFEQTTRYVRGRIVERLRALPPGHSVSLLDVHRAIAAQSPARTQADVDEAAAALAHDGIVVLKNGRLSL